MGNEKCVGVYLFYRGGLFACVNILVLGLGEYEFVFYR